MFNVACQDKAYLKEAGKLYKIAGLNACMVMKVPEAESFKQKLT
jgi:hypothetical protein